MKRPRNIEIAAYCVYQTLIHNPPSPVQHDLSDEDFSDICDKIQSMLIPLQCRSKRLMQGKLNELEAMDLFQEDQ